MSEIIITAYGHDKIIDKIMVKSFEGYSDGSTYRSTINSLELKGNSWVTAKEVYDNHEYQLASFLPRKFNVILKLDNIAVQKVLREIDFADLAIAIKSAKEAIQEKVFSNISRRAAILLRDEMSTHSMAHLLTGEIIDSQEKIIGIIHHLESTGEITINYDGGTAE